MLSIGLLPPKIVFHKLVHSSSWNFYGVGLLKIINVYKEKRKVVLQQSQGADCTFTRSRYVKEDKSPGDAESLFVIQSMAVFCKNCHMNRAIGSNLFTDLAYDICAIVLAISEVLSYYYKPTVFSHFWNIHLT